MAPHEEEKDGLLHTPTTEYPEEKDSSSIHSFASSSTLTSSPILSNEENEKKFTNNHSSSSMAMSSTHTHKRISSVSLAYNNSSPQQQQSSHPIPWQKTPLTPRGLALLFYRLLITILYPLVPSFLRPGPSKPRRLHPTSYLDGLRGLAAFIVFLDHMALNWYYALRNGYLNTETDNSILQFPIIRLIFAGRASVCIFFAMSGFVLSYKALSQIRQGSSAQAGVLGTLSSSIFRRSMRLYLPIIVGTFLSMILANYACYTPVVNRGDLEPPLFPTFYEQFWHWEGTIKALLYPFRNVDPDIPDVNMLAYNGHLWTIPIEFYGSMAVFSVTLAVSRLQTAWRMCIVAGLSWWNLRVGRWDLCLFLGGILLAELSIIKSASDAEAKEEGPLPYHRQAQQPNTYTLPSNLASFHPALRIATKLIHLARRLLTPLHILKTPFMWLLFLSTLFTLSYAGESPLPGLYHQFLIPYIPEHYNNVFLGPEKYVLSISALLLIYSLLHLPPLQSLLSMRIPQYLGDVSYSLYIMHGMVFFTLGTTLQERWTGVVGKEEWVNNGAGELMVAVVKNEVEGMEVGTWGYFWAFCVTATVCWCIALWAGDLFWRVVDTQCVRVGRRVEMWMVRRDKEEGQGRERRS